MNTFKSTKLTAKRLALSVAILASANGASAFMVDSSQEKVVTVSRSAVTKHVAQKPVYTYTQSAQTQTATKAQASVQQNYSYNYTIDAEDAPSYTRTPTPAPQVSESQTTRIAPKAHAPQVEQAVSSNYSTQANYANAFDQLAVSTSSSAVAVYDLKTGQTIYAKNVDTTRSIASISKIMTAMVILDAELDMREEITVISSDLVGAKQASTNLRAGDRMTRSEFTLLMLMKSENPAAKALARTYPGGYDAFISAMNRKAQELGMYQTGFKDSSGLDPRNVSSANDLVKMMKAVNSDPRYHSIRNFSTSPSYDFYIANYNSGDRTYKANNTNRLVRAGSHPIGVQKTGYIREAGYSVVMETNVNNRPAIIVLLGGKSSNSRWNDAENILTELAYRR